MTSLDPEGSRIRDIRGNEIAMIFQEPMTSLSPLHTIGAQIIEAIMLHQAVNMREAEERAIAALDAVRIGNAREFIRSYPHQYSGGMRQRAMIAMALSCNPSVLIADEPTTALDVTIQAQILELMKELTRRLGVALIVITHNLGIVARYADRVNVMYAGKIIESGTAQEIYHDPQHPYTLALLKSVPRMDRPRQARLDPVQGQPPDLMRLDNGCAFRPRCGYATARCAQQIPPLVQVGDDGHLAACWESQTVAGAMQRAS
jgi:oligopeptide/dipeptide ABC transporter ATP-binding protein